MSETGDTAKLFRPALSDRTVTDLTLRLYGMHVLTCRELDSYDDRNFHIMVDDNDVQNVHLQGLCPHGYVLKVLNSLDSKEPEVIKTKCDIILHARSRGFPTPGPVPNRSGQLYSLETITRERPETSSADAAGGGDAKDTDIYLVRLFEFLPGTTLASVQLTPRLAYQVGRYAAMLDKTLMDFDVTGCPELVVAWNMQNIPSLIDKLHHIKDPEKVKVVSEVIEEFRKLLDDHDTYQTGIIHSDLNDHNILVQPAVGELSSPSTCTATTNARTPETITATSSSSSGQEMDVCGILDFGDITTSLLIVEVAIAMAYMSVRCPMNFDPDEVAGLVLAGYLSEVSLSARDLWQLPLAVCARFSQTLTVGHHRLSLDPDNTYIMVHANKVWPHLHRLWSRPRGDTLAIWRKVAESRDVTFPKE